MTADNEKDIREICSVFKDLKEVIGMIKNTKMEVTDKEVEIIFNEIHPPKKVKKTKVKKVKTGKKIQIDALSKYIELISELKSIDNKSVKELVLKHTEILKEVM